MSVLASLKSSKTGRATESDRQEVTLDIKGRAKAFKVEMMAMSLITPDPNQPRKRFDPAKLNELADDIKTRGFLQPPGVRDVGNGQFMLVFGERRFRASRILNLDQIPVVILDTAEASDILEAQLVENTKRQDFELLELVDGFLKLARLLGGVGKAALRMSISSTLASQYLAIAKANDEVRALVDERVTTDIRTLYDLTVLEGKNPQAYKQVLAKLTAGGEGQATDVRNIVREAKSESTEKKGKASKPKSATKPASLKGQVLRPTEVGLDKHPVQEDSFLLKMVIGGEEQTFLLNISQATDLERQLRQNI